MEKLEIPNQDRTLMQFIEDHFIKDKDVYEVVMYAIACLSIDEAVTIAQMSKSSEIRGIAPQSYYLMKKYDQGLTTNKFWIENYAPIKMQLTLTNIKQETGSKYIGLSTTDDADKDIVRKGLKASRAVLMTRLDVLTLIAFLWKGPGYAQDFDSHFRIIFQLSDEHERFYSHEGI